MREGLLSNDEISALMDLFGPSHAQPQKRASTQGARQKDAALNTVGSDMQGVARLKAELEAEAERWKAGLETVTGRPVQIVLQTIVKTTAVMTQPSEALFQLLPHDNRFLILTEPLVNLVNEKSLGAQETVPELRHPLSAIDRKLFETTGAFFAAPGRLASDAALPKAAAQLEGRFNVEIAPLLRTTLRVVYIGESV